MRAINEYQLLPLGRVYFQTKSQFWHSDPLGQLGGLRMIGTDTPADRIWNTSEIQGTPEGMLQAYLGPRHALALQEIAERDRASKIKNEVLRFLPALHDQVIATYTKLWQEDPFQLGAVAFAQPGQLSWILDAARRPDKRTFFAGEHTGVRIGWMNGAIESGERAASEVLACTRVGGHCM
jgi:monoamine oxidase